MTHCNHCFCSSCSNEMPPRAPPTFHITDDQCDEESVLALLYKKDFGSFRQSVRREHVRAQFSDKKSLLHYTVASRDMASVEHVLSLGADVNCVTASGYTPLIIAVLYRSVIKYLNQEMT